MTWIQSPFFWMGTINILTGIFSAIAGGRKAATAVSASVSGVKSNPINYVVGGLLTSLIGVGNLLEYSIATWGTILFILTSMYDGWLGNGSKDWRFSTLTAFVIVQTILVIWSATL
ncbi:hypothetical protein M4951_16320 [Blastopirellula sp. J2-11]|uniref:hypothetical protein n=1 Tax=Blastopirellula sp. J2-11 TaxID=2943192 RepID=UPI0021C5FD11|nr:hypothetical protein [Blastopirellula sp. J2-11]UUO04946.1 hypothetical protein M4951_16320 [Blastopirellula sp. J2-11]